MVKLGPMLFVASTQFVVGVDPVGVNPYTVSVVCKFTTPNSGDAGSADKGRRRLVGGSDALICGIAAGGGDVRGSSDGHIYLLDTRSYVHMFCIKQMWDVATSPPKWVRTFGGRRHLAAPTAIAAGLIDKKMRV